MTGCTSRSTPSSTPTSTRWASGRAAGSLSRPFDISMYQSQNSDHVKS
jgi:hypothetical protein